MEENEEELIKTFKKLEKKLRSEIKKMPSTIVTGANRSRLSAIIALSVLAVIAFLILAIKHIKQ